MIPAAPANNSPAETIATEAAPVDAVPAPHTARLSSLGPEGDPLEVRLRVVTEQPLWCPRTPVQAPTSRDC